MKGAPQKFRSLTLSKIGLNSNIRKNFDTDGGLHCNNFFLTEAIMFQKLASLSHSMELQSLAILVKAPLYSLCNLSANLVLLVFNCLFTCVNCAKIKTRSSVF